MQLSLKHGPGNLTKGKSLLAETLIRHIRQLRIFDIGARGGLHDRWHKLHPIIGLLGFEPEEAECEALNQGAAALPYKARFLPYALGERTDATVKFYACRKPGCSSTYKPNDQFIKDFPFAPNMVVESVSTMQTVSLSDVCLKEKTLPDVLKIDVQGAELDILKGGQEVLSHAKVIELEVEFNPQYEGQPLFHDVDKFMVHQGWRLLGLRRDYWRRTKGLDRNTSGCGGQLVHGDALYYNAALLEQPAISAEDVLKFGLIFSVYRQNDFVLSLLKHPVLGNLLSSSEREALEESIIERNSVMSTIMGWALGGMTQRARRKLVDELQRGDASDWHDADFF